MIEDLKIHELPLSFFHIDRKSPGVFARSRKTTHAHCRYNKRTPSTPEQRGWFDFVTLMSSTRSLGGFVVSEVLEKTEETIRIDIYYCRSNLRMFSVRAFRENNPLCC